MPGNRLSKLLLYARMQNRGGACCFPYQESGRFDIDLTSLRACAAHICVRSDLVTVLDVGSIIDC